MEKDIYGPIKIINGFLEITCTLCGDTISKSNFDIVLKEGVLSQDDISILKEHILIHHSHLIEKVDGVEAIIPRCKNCKQISDSTNEKAKETCSKT